VLLRHLFYAVVDDLALAFPKGLTFTFFIPARWRFVSFYLFASFV